MTLNRRAFVGSVGTSLFISPGAGAAPLPSRTPSGEADYSRWETVRGDFDLAPNWLHFSQFYIVSHPRPVRAAIERYRRELDANPFTVVEEGMGFAAFLNGASAESRPERVRRAAAAYIGCRPDEIALTDSTTQGLALIYQGLALKPGDEVLATTHDHYVHHEAIRLATRRNGASTRRVALYDSPASASEDEMAERLRRAIGLHTRVVALTWVHSCSGVRLPVRRLAAVVAEANRRRDDHGRVLLVLDAVHGFGNQSETLPELGCDFAAAGTHKWIFAPRGTGIIWAPASNWGLLQPTIPTFYSVEPFKAWEEEHAPEPATQAAWVSPGGFKAYEHQWAMAEAFEFHSRIGRQRIAQRIAALNSQCKEGLAGIPKVQVLTPRTAGLSAGIICFQVEGQTPEETVHRLLQRKVIASTSPYKVSYARLAPSLVNDEEQVELALRALRAIV